MTRAVLELTGKPETLIRHVTDRPGHDRRYAVDCAKAEAELGWRALTTFEAGLAATVEWYRSHRQWVERVRSGPIAPRRWGEAEGRGGVRAGRVLNSLEERRRLSSRRSHEAPTAPRSRRE